VDKQQLFKPRLAEAEVDVDGVGTVRVRALSRIEVFLAQQVHDDEAAFERKILRAGMVDPKLTEAEIERWQKASPAGELQPVIDKVRGLSKMDDNSSKSGVPDVRGGPGDGVRPLPGGEAGHDRGADAPGDL
jgi:hypothetical protein